MSSDLKLLSDEEIVKLYRNGSDNAFGELYERYSVKLKRLIYYHIHDKEDANDVFHDVFVRVFKHLDTYNEERPFSSWIYQITLNCTKNYSKRAQRDNVYVDKSADVVDTLQEDNVSPEDMYIGEEDIKEFYRAVEMLRDKFKSVFLLRFSQGLKYNEISKILKCSERTVKWRMQKSMEHIADYLKERGIV